MARTDRARTPGAVSMAITTATFLVIATFSLTARTTPPPTIAEFAPQSQKQITESQSEQAAAGLDGEGGAGGGGGGTTTTSTSTTLPGAEDDPAAIDVPRVRRCVGDPPRQTEDPQSPPCVAYWEGDNGGATWQGVTGNEIKVVIPTFDVPFDEAVAAAFENYFNKRFEFYGRRINLIPVAFANNGWLADPAKMQAEAVQVDEEIGAFASLSYPYAEAREFFYYDALADREILSVAAISDMRHEAHYRAHAPYQWSYLPSLDHSQRNLAELVCKTMAGRPAAYAGPPPVGKTWPETRKFAAVEEAAFDHGTPDLSILYAELKRLCGLEPLRLVWDYQTGDNRAFVARLADERITTVLYFGDSATASGHPREATIQRYFPEWMGTPYGRFDQDSGIQAWTKDQSEHVFSIRAHTKLVRAQDMPWYAALKEGDPESDPQWAYQQAYQALLLLASGIQMAGPELTPASFEAGLFKARFPNPGAGGPPWYQGRVGFNERNHTMVRDHSMVWWNNNEVSGETGQPGRFCYVSSGVRHGLGSWPTEPPAWFEPPCL